MFFLTLTVTAQDQYDVRKTKWGMAYSEVMSSEYPLLPTESQDDQLTYDNVKLQNGSSASITYYFKNRKLIKVAYWIFGYNFYPYRGTCTNKISLFDKIKYTSFIFDALKEKGMKCSFGWLIEINDMNIVKNEIVPFKCNFNKDIIEKMEKLSENNGHKTISLYFSNERTNATFWFEDHQYWTKKDTLLRSGTYNLGTGTFSTKEIPCNDDRYNRYYTLFFEPSLKLETEMKKGDF